MQPLAESTTKGYGRKREGDVKIKSLSITALLFGPGGKTVILGKVTNYWIHQRFVSC
jgi:hypothetical protein